MIAEERLLTDEAFQVDMWAEAAAATLAGEWEIDEQIDYYGTALADAVVTGEMKIADLRAASNEMNALDRGAVEMSEGDIENLADADYFEAVARRLGNQTTKFALSKVRSEQRRRKHAKGYTQRSGHAVGAAALGPMPGLGMPEHGHRGDL